MTQPLGPDPHAPDDRAAAAGFRSSRFHSEGGLDPVASAVLEALDAAVFWVGANGVLYGANRAGRMLRAHRHRGDSVAEAVVAAVGREIHAGRANAALVHLSEVFRGRRFDIRVLPFPGAEPSSLIVVRESAPPIPLGERELVRDHGLTRKEAEVARRLALGSSPEGIARELGLALETVRGHLKGVYQKLRVHRQAELVAFLLGVPRPATN